MARQWLAETWNFTSYMSPVMYAYGNTPMQDILQDLNFNTEKVDILLLGAGDIRHIIKTVTSVNEDDACRIKELCFHLNDLDDVVVARDILLLHLVSTVNPNDPEDILFIWAVWYNMELSPHHHKRLVDTLKGLCEGDESPIAKEKKVLYNFGDTKTRDQCVSIWKNWLTEDVDKKLTQEHRNDYMNWSNERKIAECTSEPKLPDLSEDAAKKRRGQIKKETMSLLKNNLLYSLVNEALMTETQFLTDATRQIKEWIRRGSILPTCGGTSNGVATKTSLINPTLMRPGQQQWHPHYISNPFQGYVISNRMFSEHGLTNACFVVMKELISQFQEKRTSVKLSVTAWWGDCIPLCLHHLPTDALFDLIHTSNLADHLGLLPLLTVCEPRLKKSRSLLLTASMRWSSQYKSLGDYVYGHLGFSTHYLPTIFGLHLAEDLDLGLTTPPYFGSSREVQIRWMRCEHTNPEKVTISDDSDLHTVIHRLLSTMFTGHKSLNDDTGFSLRSPVLAMAIMDKLKDKISEGVGVLLSMLKNIEPGHKNDCELACFNAIKAAYALHENTQPSDELLCVEVPISNRGFPQPSDPDRIGYSPPAVVICVPRQSGYSSNTMLLLMKKNEGFFKSSLLNYKLDLENGFVQLLMLKTDWMELREHYSVGILVDNRPHVIIPVSLVSPGVHIVNAWSVPPHQGNILSPAASSTSALIQLENVEESENGYKITWDVDNKDDKITLDLPEKTEKCCTLKFRVNCQSWPSSQTARVLFSCCVDINTLHIKIANRRGKIFANISKCPRWNTGCCLLPFRKMRLDKMQSVSHNELMTLHSLQFKIELMFCGLGEIGNSKQCQLTDPFFNLRETLQVIFETMPTNYRIVMEQGFDKNNANKCRENDMDILCLGAYINDGTPILHVAYLQHQQLNQMLKEGQILPTVAQVVCTKLLAQTNLSMWRPIPVDDREKYLMLKMLHTNSLRFHQPHVEEGHPYIRHSFVQMLYPDVAVDMEKLMQNGIDFVRKARQEQPETSIEEIIAIAKDKHGPCGTCGKITVKFCSRCKHVYYCSPVCQKAGWKIHKLVCKSP